MINKIRSRRASNVFSHHDLLYTRSWTQFDKDLNVGLGRCYFKSNRRITWLTGFKINHALALRLVWDTTSVTVPIRNIIYGVIICVPNILISLFVFLWYSLQLTPKPTGDLGWIKRSYQVHFTVQAWLPVTLLLRSLLELPSIKGKHPPHPSKLLIPH